MAGYTNTAEDKLLLSRAFDAIELSERRCFAQYMGFLNEHEQKYLSEHIARHYGVRFFGGYPGAVRVMLGVGCEDDGAFPITPLQITYPPRYALEHRDILGSLMGLGLRRDTVGDILADEGRAVVFVRDDVAPFVLQQLCQIGRVGVTLSPADPDDLPAAQEVQERVYTISSLRLDVFVAAVTGLSREKAAALIRSELVTIDHVVHTEVSRTLYEGATVTIRKYGKYVLSAMLGSSRKGKLRVSVKHF